MDVYSKAVSKSSKSSVHSSSILSGISDLSSNTEPITSNSDEKLTTSIYVTGTSNSTSNNYLFLNPNSLTVNDSGLGVSNISIIAFSCLFFLILFVIILILVIKYKREHKKYSIFTIVDW